MARDWSQMAGLLPSPPALGQNEPPVSPPQGPSTEPTTAGDGAHISHRELELLGGEMRELISHPCCRQAAQMAQVQGEGRQKLLQAARPILSTTALATKAARGGATLVGRGRRRPGEDSCGPMCCPQGGRAACC